MFQSKQEWYCHEIAVTIPLYFDFKKAHCVLNISLKTESQFALHWCYLFLSSFRHIASPFPTSLVSLFPGSCDKHQMIKSNPINFMNIIFLLSPQNLSSRTSWCPVGLLEAFCWVWHRKDPNVSSCRGPCRPRSAASSVGHWVCQSNTSGLARQLGSFYISGFCLLKLGKTRIC